MIMRSSVKPQLRVPKLIVRKVKRKEGDNEVETLEVYSPEKNGQIFQVNTAHHFDRSNISRKSSVSLSESIKREEAQETSCYGYFF